MSVARHQLPRLLVLASTCPASPADTAPAFVRDLTLHEAAYYDPTVLVPSVPNSAPAEQIGTVAVRRFRYFPRRWEDLADGAILENLRRRRSRWLQVAPFLLAETAAIQSAIRRLRPDVMHVHWIIPQGLACLLVRRRPPMLVTTLGGDVYALRGRLARRLISAVVRRAALVTAMNTDMRRRLIELGSDPRRTVVLPMGADVEGIRRRAAGITPVPGRLLFVGRLVEKKGLAVLLAALRGLPPDSVHLRVVGDGPLRAELERAGSGLPVEFLGALHRDELAREYAAASLLVFPSVAAAGGDQDGLPVALLEGMAAGRPVVASDLPGLADAVVSGESGQLVPSGDVQALATAIEQLLSDPERSAALGRGAALRAESYGVDRVGAAYVQLLDWVRQGRDPDQIPDFGFGK
jgi:glycosyltransferase involved in cell wall biosynthesis